MNGNRLLKLSAITLTAFTLVGCSTKDGSFFNILQLPGKILDSVFDNNSCQIKREKVEKYTKLHYEILREEIKAQKGTHIDELMRLAEIEEQEYATMKKQLKKSYKIIFHNTQRVSEQLVQNMSKLYEVKEKTKKINGFSYTEVLEITKRYVDQNFEKIRLAIKNSETDIFIPLSEELKIKNQKKKEKFIGSLKGEHFELYDDLLVVSVMIKGV
jgi:iron-sulfur cluster repair protein YtfE (RIC family)